MEIKTSLKQLTALFAQSAATEELTVPVRRFAAQLTILTAHVQRIEATAKRVTNELEGRLAAIEGLLAAAQQAAGPDTAVSVGAPTEQEPAEMSEDDEAEVMAAKVIAETEAELQAITNGTDEPEQPVVMPPPARKNGGKKAPRAGDVA